MSSQIGGTESLTDSCAHKRLHQRAAKNFLTWAETIRYSRAVPYLLSKRVQICGNVARVGFRDAHVRHCCQWFQLFAGYESNATYSPASWATCRSPEPFYLDQIKWNRCHPFSKVVGSNSGPAMTSHAVFAEKKKILFQTVPDR